MIIKSCKITTFITCAFLSSFFLFPEFAVCKMRSNNKVLAGTPPFEIAKKIITTNNNEVASPSAFQDKYSPIITWLTDPDVRIQPQLIVGSPINKLHTVRNMGAQLEASAAGIEYGIRHLHTPVLLITLNSDNQAIRLFMEEDSELSPVIKQQLTALKIQKKEVRPKEIFLERLIKNVEANIDYQVKVAISQYKDRITQGRLAVLGSIIDFENYYKRGAGRLIIINVNGETDNNKLRNLPIITSISPKLRKLSIGRERINVTSKEKPESMGKDER